MEKPEQTRAQKPSFKNFFLIVGRAIVFWLLVMSTLKAWYWYYGETPDALTFINSAAFLPAAVAASFVMSICAVASAALSKITGKKTFLYWFFYEFLLPEITPILLSIATIVFLAQYFFSSEPNHYLSASFGFCFVAAYWMPALRK